MAGDNNSSIDTNNAIDGNVQVESVDGPENRTIEQLLRLIMFESTEHFRIQKLNELKKLATSQSEIGFLNNLRRVFMLGANEDGSFDVNDELKKLLDKVSNPGSEGLMQLLNDLGLTFNASYSSESFQNLFAGIDALEDPELSQSLLDQLSALGIDKDQEPTAAQLEELVKFVSQPENLQLRQHLTGNSILSTKEKFTKAERENFIESIRLTVEQKSTINEMTSQTIIRLQSEIDKMQTLVVQLLKDYEGIKKKINNNIGKHA